MKEYISIKSSYNKSLNFQKIFISFLTILMVTRNTNCIKIKNSKNPQSFDLTKGTNINNK